MSKKFIKGNEAIAEAAMRAGLTDFYGYPITPATEILEYLAANLKDDGKVFLQTESEIAAINAVYGAASLGGRRVMTATSGPGMSLKVEGLSYLAASRLPFVIVNIMRGGPGLGDIQPSQGDYFQIVKGGGHGDYHLIVFAPSTVQEAADLTMTAFDLADKYRMGVCILADGVVGQSAEAVEFRDYKIVYSPKPWALNRGGSIRPFDLDPEVYQKINFEMQKDYREAAKEVRFETINIIPETEIIIVAFGTCARIAKTVIKETVKIGVTVGLFRPITLWPFPYKALRNYYELNPTAKFLVIEMNAGQMLEDVQLACGGVFDQRINFYGWPGGIVPTPEEILSLVEQIKKDGGCQPWLPK